MTEVLEALRLASIWLMNGLLVVAYGLVEQAVLLALMPPLVWFLVTAPREQKPAVFSVSLLAIITAAFTPLPIPIILLAMAWAGLVAVRLDRHTPNALRWRVTSGLGLEALAALGVTLSWTVLNSLTPTAFGALAGADEAGALLGQGRSYLNTLFVLGTWFAIPLFYFGLLVQGMLVHPPRAETPEQLIYRVRSGGQK